MPAPPLTAVSRLVAAVAAVIVMITQPLLADTETSGALELAGLARHRRTVLHLVLAARAVLLAVTHVTQRDARVAAALTCRVARERVGWAGALVCGERTTITTSRHFETIELVGECGSQSHYDVIVACGLPQLSAAASSDSSAQSASPSHTQRSLIHVPSLHVNWCAKHVRLPLAVTQQ